MTPGSSSFQAAMAAWAAELDLDCAPDVLATARTTVIRHGAAFAGKRVAFALATTTTCVVTVPADWRDAAREALAPLRPTEAFDARRLAGVFGPAAQRVVGPAWQGHLDADGFAPVDPRGTRPLAAADREDLDVLAAACDTREWEASAVNLDQAPVFGCVAGDRLVAAGTLAPWRDRFWHVGIITSRLPRAGIRAGGGECNDPLWARPRLAAPLSDPARQCPLGRGRSLARLSATRPDPGHPSYPDVTRAFAKGGGPARRGRPQDPALPPARHRCAHRPAEGPGISSARARRRRDG